MERLAMRDIVDIIYRLRKGESDRAVARDLAHHRVTIARYRELAEQHGFLDPDGPLPAPDDLLAALGDPAPPPAFPSSIDPFAPLVEDWLKRGVEMKAIHRLLCRQHGYTGSYSAVRRYVRRQHPVPKEAFVRIETAPGEEAQVDFGTVGKLFDPATGKVRTAYSFVMTLSFSRHQYVEFVFDQKIATFIACHRRAFESFGGVVRRVLVDNLKAAVLKVALEDPVLSAPYRQMAQHYGFLIHPCRPRTPEHKGKVESGVHFVERNLWPELVGKDLPFANLRSRAWVLEYAGLRTHGTTKKLPLEQFHSIEREALLPLPSQPFEFEELRDALVHRDCHVVVDGSYYSAPHRFVGARLAVHVYEHTVQLYDSLDLVVTHERARERGKRVTRNEHYPDDKRIYLERTPEACLEQAKQVGEACLGVAHALMSDRSKDKRRALSALIGLEGKYGKDRLEAACRMAIACCDPRYMRVKSILSAGIETALLPEEAQVTDPPPVYRFARRGDEFFSLRAARFTGVRPC